MCVCVCIILYYKLDALSAQHIDVDLIVAARLFISPFVRQKKMKKNEIEIVENGHGIRIGPRDEREWDRT